VLRKVLQNLDIDVLFCSPVSVALLSIWAHGHTHDSVDLDIAGTRIVCNPRGYAPDDLNPEFHPGLVVEV
jgi:hypothetical protein